MAAKGDKQATSSVGEAASSDDATRFTDLGLLRARSLFVVLSAVAGVGLAWFMPEVGAITGASGWMTGPVDWGLSFLSDLASSAGSKSFASGGNAPASAQALVLGLLVASALLPIAVLARGLRLAMRAHQAQLAGDVSSFSDRTSAITGFSRPRRARLEGDALGASGRFEIRGGLVRIGRADDNELVLDQAGLDPYHAAIEQTVDFDIYLCDLTRGSRKAPRVNGRSVRRQRLCDGDLITLGRVQLTYRTSNR